MKKNLTCFCILFFSINSFSQDVITKKNGADIKAKISEVNEAEVKYKKFDNLNGPYFTIKKSEILMIRYENGTKDIFSDSDGKVDVKNPDDSKAVIEKLIIPAGTLIKVEVLQEVTSKNAKSGDILSFSTVEPVVINNKVYVPKGSPVTGMVKDVDGKRGLGKAGSLNISIDYLTMPDGSKVKLNGSPSVKGKNTLGSAVAVALIVNPLFLLHKGKDAKIKKGDIYNVYVE